MGICKIKRSNKYSLSDGYGFQPRASPDEFCLRDRGNVDFSTEGINE